MNYTELSLKLPPNYSETELRSLISKKVNLKDFSFEILKKSLDARKKGNIYWLLNVRVISGNLKGENYIPNEEIPIPYKKRNKKVVIIGSGPAGMFAALFLQKAGFTVTVLERGAEVDSRGERIANFEQTGIFDVNANYAFGEGGAGTFSDGKLTSRSKHISLERAFIMDAYIRAGAPKEIKYLAHPHLGSDNLKIIVKNLRYEFLRDGGTIEFESFAHGLNVNASTIKTIINVNTSENEYHTDFLIVASGHSSYETYRMLMKHGVGFRVKNYALGSRVEHSQKLINEAQWGVSSLDGVKAAEYRLTANIPGMLPVYTFCMCPGGTIVPSTAYADTNIVNGMSNYARNGEYANSALVSSVNLSNLLAREVSAEEALAWTENLERSFYSDKYTAPACTIKDFLQKSSSFSISGSSYPLNLSPAPLWEMLPEIISESLREGLKVFTRKLRGFDEGMIMGLESKTSAPIQVLRASDGLCDGFSNLYMAGEGSGYAGGIISSATDGIKTSLDILDHC